MRTSTSIVALIFTLLPLTGTFVPAALAANWQAIATPDGQRVDIDRSRIAFIDRGKAVAWSRLLGNGTLPLGSTRYTSIEQLGRYDCDGRTYTILKRVYLLGGVPVKEERVSSLREATIASDSAEDKLLTEACRQYTASNRKATPLPALPATTTATATATASKAAPAATAAVPIPGEQPAARVMLADVRQIAAGQEAHLQTTAASSGDSLPSTSTSSTALPASPPAARLSLPNRADLAARAAAEKAALLPGNSPARPPTPAPTARNKTTPTTAEESPSSPSLSLSPSSPPPPAARPSYLRQISRGAPRRKVATPPPPPPEPRLIRWSYDGEGGPANWANLRSDYSACGFGKRQSPIDIRDAIRVDLAPIRFDYRPSRFRVTDNGHTVQVDVASGSSITLLGRRFELTQLHFHRPSEERINGRAYDMSAHLVHRDLDGQIAVVAVLLERQEENPLIQLLWNHLPLEVGQEVNSEVAINLIDLIPENRGYWTYMGSLTTPPCSEDVLWMVMKQPQPISAEQVSIFARLYRNNARPIQPVNGRIIKESR
jgi:carbonic anhydrase